MIKGGFIKSYLEYFPIHDYGDTEQNDYKKKDSCQCALPYFLNHSKVYFDPKWFFFLPGNTRMKKPKDKVLQVRDESNDKKDNHIHVPIEFKCQHDVGMIERLGFNFQLIFKIGLTAHIQTIVN